MRAATFDILPSRLRRSLAQLGVDIGIARRKRRLTMKMMTERLGVAKSTYQRVERGDPRVALGIYAMTLFVLGFGDALGKVVDPAKDDQGLLLEVARLPKRVRNKKDPTAS